MFTSTSSSVKRRLTTKILGLYLVSCKSSSQNHRRRCIMDLVLTLFSAYRDLVNTLGSRASTISPFSHIVVCPIIQPFSTPSSTSTHLTSSSERRVFPFATFSKDVGRPLQPGNMEYDSVLGLTTNWTHEFPRSLTNASHLTEAQSEVRCVIPSNRTDCVANGRSKFTLVANLTREDIEIRDNKKVTKQDPLVRLVFHVY